MTETAKKYVERRAEVNVAARVINLCDKIRAHNFWDEDYLYEFTMGLLADPSDLADWEACFDVDPILSVVK